MKSRYLFFLFPLFIFSAAPTMPFAEPKKCIDIIVRPGVGINDIRFDSSSSKEITHFEKLKFEQQDLSTNICGDYKSSIRLKQMRYNRNNGVFFYLEGGFFQTWPESNLPMKPVYKLYKIEVIHNPCACLENGICLMTSTLADIESEFGAVTVVASKNVKSVREIILNTLGITFSIDSTDKLIGF